MKPRYWEALLKFVLITFGGLILAQIITLGIAYAFGYDLEKIKALGGNFLSEAPSTLIKLSLLSSHIFTFIIPGLLFAFLWYKKEIWSALHLNKKVDLRNLGICILLLIIAYPAVSYSYTVNSWIPLPEWMHTQEANTMETMKKILEMNNLPGFLFSLLLVSIIPGIGEELIFRGILQKLIEKGTGKGHLAVWIASILFSSFHLQFEGFLPRMLLGLILGYSFYYTRNLWIPIILHMLNNAIPIISLYFAGDDLATLDPSESEGVAWYLGIGSLIFAIAIVNYLDKKSVRDERA